MHLQMHWNGALDASDPVHLLQVSPEGQSPPPKVPKSMSRYPSNGGSMGTLTADSLQGIRGKGAHLGLGSDFIENESRGQFLWPILCSLCLESAVRGCIYPSFEGGVSTRIYPSFEGGMSTRIYPSFEGGRSMLAADEWN